jgi:hypothetical protein
MKFQSNMNRSRRALGTILILAIAALAMLVVTEVASAHESRMVGPYTFVVGFAVEPAFEGQMNGVQLHVREGEAANASPVEGLEETLQVEVTHVASGASELMALRAVFGDPGHYTNNWIPTAPGQYRFRFFGTVGDLDVDETFESGPDTFGSVEAADTLYFPEDVPAARELEGVVRGAQTSANEALGLALDADEQVGGLQTLLIVSIVLAAVALAAAVLAFVASRRRG